jgi:hypothetical protein
MPFTASKTAAETMAAGRICAGGGSPADRMAAESVAFQSVTMSAEADRGTIRPNRAKVTRENLIRESCMEVPPSACSQAGCTELTLLMVNPRACYQLMGKLL